MAYEIGSYIDLSFINKKKVEKKTAQETAGRLFDIGTTFIAKYTDKATFKMARRIEVAVAA